MARVNQGLTTLAEAAPRKGGVGLISESRISTNRFKTVRRNLTLRDARFFASRLNLAVVDLSRGQNL